MRRADRLAVGSDAQFGTICAFDIFQDEMKQFRPGVSLWLVFAGFARVFDIVNGFLIDAVAVSYQRV